MNVVVAMDSFKGSVSSIEAGKAVERGIHNALSSAEVVVRPLADGGEGTVEALTIGMGGELVHLTVTGPNGKPVEGVYGMIQAKKTAVIAMSSAAGITLLSEKERNPFYTTTYGVGEMIKHAIHRGCRHFVIGLGGSATNDGGVGMLQALGFDFLNQEGKQISYGAYGIKDLISINETHKMEELNECTFVAACDVNNPLCGKNGCSRVFGPQKGATEEMIVNMDVWLNTYARISKKRYPSADDKVPGCGAAGGLGFALLTFLKAELQSGIELILEETELDEYIQKADIVITGEGRLDAQTVMGKAPFGVAKLAKKYGKKVIGISGSASKDADVCNQYGIDAFFTIMQGVCTLEEALNAENTTMNLTRTAEQIFRLLR